jgi:hypothetical protein
VLPETKRRESGPYRPRRLYPKPPRRNTIKMMMRIQAQIGIERSLRLFVGSDAPAARLDSCVRLVH